MKTDLKSNAATVGAVAAGESAPGGAGNFQPQFTTSDQERQPLADLSRLAALAQAARKCGNYTAFWRLRRRFLLLQAALYSVEEMTGSLRHCPGGR